MPLRRPNAVVTPNGGADRAVVIASDILAGLGGIASISGKSNTPLVAPIGGFVLDAGMDKAAADVSVECIFEGESPRARSGGRRRGKNVAKEAGLGVASRHRDLARHVVRHVVIAGQEDLLQAERVLVNLVVCCAH